MIEEKKAEIAKQKKAQKRVDRNGQPLNFAAQ